MILFGDRVPYTLQRVNMEIAPAVSGRRPESPAASETFTSYEVLTWETVAGYYNAAIPLAIPKDSSTVNCRGACASLCCLFLWLTSNSASGISGRPVARTTHIQAWLVSALDRHFLICNRQHCLEQMETGPDMPDMNRKLLIRHRKTCCLD